MSRGETRHRRATRVRKGSLSNHRFFREKYRFVHVSEIPVTGGPLILIFVQKTGTGHSLALKFFRNRNRRLIKIK